MHKMRHNTHLRRLVFLLGLGFSLGAGLMPAILQAQNRQSAIPAGFIADPENGCATSNPIPRVGETIRWAGACGNGLLQGPGTLLWLRDGKPRERNEGTFVDGELDGQASTTFADGTLVVGQYSHGIRHGEFVVRRPSGATIRAVYANGTLVSERQLETQDVRQMRERPTQAIPQPVAQPSAPAYQPAYQQPAYQQPAYPAYVPTTVAPTQPQSGVAYISPWSPSAYRGPDVTAGPAYQAPVYQQPVYQPPVYQAPPYQYQQPAYQQPVYQAPVYQAPVYQAPVYQPPAYMAAPYPQPVAAAAMYEAASRVNALGGPDLALGDAMMLERAGRNAEAGQLYGQIALVAGNTATGILANERASRLRAPPVQMVAYPGAALPLAGTTPLNYAERRQALSGRYVCTAADIFPNRANWCGRVLREEGNDVEVEIRSVRLNSFFAIGFASAPCTGNRFLSIFSSGKRIWVSRGCLGGDL
jgi:hypothetical protein